jgi:hypothetical protein
MRFASPSSAAVDMFIRVFLSLSSVSLLEPTRDGGNL